MRTNSIFSLFFSSTLIALAASQAAANDGTPPEIFEMIQQGQNVTVTVGIFDPFGEPDISQAFDLVRSGPEGTVKVIEAEVFDPEDGELVDVHCHNHDFDDPTTFCEENPTDCEDCDGDSVAECPTTSPGLIACAGFITFDIVDECVPPGDTTYIFQTPENESEYMRGEGSLIVEDSGEECEEDIGSDADSDSDSDADGEAGDDSDEGASGCSASGLGGGDSVPLSLAALMGLIGLVALRRGRSRE